ncbi:hypothetical protein GCM10022416_59800 [Actinomadura keratinilytica]|uniref:Uncharacterized protein n=1 Tax=Actinomadura keratinilytica TaxID=547461 RepID=A0ABP7ZHD2_9ACTN
MAITRPPRSTRRRPRPQPDTSPAPASRLVAGGRRSPAGTGRTGAASQGTGGRAWPWTTLLLGLAASPTGAALAVWQQTGDVGLAFKVAALVAAVALPLGLAVVFQDTIQTWIRHRPEMRRTRDDGRALHATAKAALAGPHDTPAVAARKRADARAYARERGWTNPTTLGDMMAITRDQAASSNRTDDPGR